MQHTHRITIILALALAGLGIVSAQRASQLQAADATAEQEVRSVERQRREALLRQDLPQLDRTMAAEYTFTTPTGQVVTKAQEMAGFKSGKTRMESFDTDDVRVRTYGNTAAVTGRARIKGRSDSQDISGEYRYTRLYVKRDGRWQIVASHFSRTAPHPPHAAEGVIPEDAEVITVRPPAAVETLQGLKQFVGISGATAGTKELSMNLVVVPAGGAAKPHLHRGFESAVYVLKGRVETRYGTGLRKSVINQAGDFLFIPANVPHQPRNLSATEAALAIVARNDPNEQENVVPYDPAEAKPQP